MDSTISTEGTPPSAPERLIALGDLGSLPETVLQDYLIAALVERSTTRKRLALFVDDLRARLGETLPNLTIRWLRSVTHSPTAVWHLADVGAVNPWVMRWRLDEGQYLEPPPAGWGEPGPPYPVRRVVMPTALCGYSRYTLEWPKDDRYAGARPYFAISATRAFEPWLLRRKGWQRPMCVRCEQAARAAILPPLSS